MLFRSIRNASTYYDPENGDGLVAKFMQDFPTFTPSHLFLGAPHSNDLTIAEGWSKTVPNHIKSLTKKTSLPEDIQQNIRDVKNNIDTQIEIELKFLRLVAVQVLTSFEDTDNDGWVEPYLPKFEPLTRTLYNNAARNNRKLLCKVKSIDNSMLNIRTPDDNFSIIDQYFIIEPSGLFARGTTETIPENRLLNTQIAGSGNRPTLDIDLGDFAETRVVTIEPRLLFNPEVELAPNFASSPTLNFGLDELESLEEEREEGEESTSTASPIRSNLSLRGGPRYGS